MLLTDKDGLSGITSTADHTGRCWADCASTPLTLIDIDNLYSYFLLLFLMIL